jgi:hypothetical protein
VSCNRSSLAKLGNAVEDVIGALLQKRGLAVWLAVAR